MLVATCVIDLLPTPVPSAPRTATSGSASVRSRRRPRAWSRASWRATVVAKLRCATRPVASIRNPCSSCILLTRWVHPAGPQRGTIGCGKLTRAFVHGFITHGRGRSCLPTRWCESECLSSSSLSYEIESLSLRSRVRLGVQTLRSVSLSSSTHSIRNSQTACDSQTVSSHPPVTSAFTIASSEIAPSSPKTPTAASARATMRCSPFHAASVSSSPISSLLRLTMGWPPCFPHIRRMLERRVSHSSSAFSVSFRCSLSSASSAAILLSRCSTILDLTPTHRREARASSVAASARLVSDCNAMFASISLCDAAVSASTEIAWAATAAARLR
eukprot:7376045-Prymnesium_polylepis.1